MIAVLEDDVKVLMLSEAERRAGKYSPATLQKGLEALNQDGLLLLKGVIDAKHIEALNVKMCADADKMRADPNKGYNHNIKSNFLQRPPLTDPSYLYPDVYFNRFLLQVANAYLGQKPIWNWLASNTALSGTKGMRQPVHKDCSFPHPQYPYYIIGNIPLCEFTAENGATEFWLGSHAHASWREQVIADKPEHIEAYPEGRMGDPIPEVIEKAKEERYKIRPPTQPACSPGDIMIRDLRLWHAGMPNGTDQHRVMLALGYQSPVYPNYSMRCHLPLSQQNFFLENAQNLTEVRANFYDDEELEHLNKDTVFDLRPTHLL